MCDNPIDELIAHFPLCYQPIVTSAHFKVFDELFSPSFINQDADPYLFELYRRAGCASYLKNVKVANGRGGAISFESSTDSEPRYVRQHLVDWKGLLQAHSRRLVSHIKDQPPVVTIDVVVPSFRTPVEVLHCMVTIPDPPGASLKFIIIVDDPASPNLRDVVALQNERVRVRVNETNLGASASRSRGLAEACAEWVLLLDDDVLLSPACIPAYVNAIREVGKEHCGFVGTTRLPPVESILYEATRMSDITFFYSLPLWLEPPWGVTANLLVRRVSGLEFDTDFAKTGGGEDVDYCIRLVKTTGLPFGRVADAVVEHDWWPAPSTFKYLSRFWKWTTGDGYLNYKHPEFVYLSFPNVIELSLATLLVCPLVCSITMCEKQLAAMWLVEVLCETSRALMATESLHLSTGRRLCAATLSTFVKNVVDAGHTAFHIRHGRLTYIFHSFDWFLGKHGLPSEDRRKFGLRCSIWLLAAVAVAAT